MTKRIVGIVLVQNEESFVTWAIGNAIDFCDEWLVIDNSSRDRTPDRLRALAAAYPKIRLIEDTRADGTNRHLQPYIGEDVWVFGLDGDEIYDRAGLMRLRAKLLAGECDRYWSVTGHSLHVQSIDLSGQTATGHVTPPAAPATKLYNFAAIESWHATTQRLHGSPVLKSGWSREDRLGLAAEVGWEACDFRNLHLCFFPRSQFDVEVETRLNISDRSFRNVVRRPLFRALQAMGLGKGRLGAYLEQRASLKKPLRYAVGEVERRGLAGFGRPADYTELDPQAAVTEAMIEEVSARRAGPSA
jgi:glycosyltransferase involved in cell wall biosynthesis